MMTLSRSKTQKMSASVIESSSSDILSHSLNYKRRQFTISEDALSKVRSGKDERSNSENRRKSLDFLPTLPDFLDKLSVMKTMKNIGKHNVGTSTSNSPKVSSDNTSFLIQIKEMEEDDDKVQYLKARTNSLRTSSPLLISKQSVTDSELISKDMPSFHGLLSRLLYTTAESLVDPSWEVRRMARQTLPLLGELLRYLLEPPASLLLCRTVDTHLTCRPTLMTWVALSLLSDCLTHAVTLARPHPRQYWQPIIAQTNIESLLGTVERNLSLWIKSCQFYLDRRTIIDCINPISLRIVIYSISHYSWIVYMAGLCKTIEHFFIRLDKNIQSNGKIGPTVHYFDIYPNINPSSSHSDNVGLEFMIQLIDLIKIDFLEMCQFLTNDKSKESSAHECIVSLTALLPILSSWLYQASTMRGENMRHLKEIMKMIHGISNMTMSYWRSDQSSNVDIHDSILRLNDVVTGFVDNKNLNIQCWWLSQLLELLFNWLAAIDYQHDSHDTQSSNNLLLSLIHRIQLNIRDGRNRRATFADLTQLNPPTNQMQDELSELPSTVSVDKPTVSSNTLIIDSLTKKLSTQSMNQNSAPKETSPKKRMSMVAMPTDILSTNKNIRRQQTIQESWQITEDKSNIELYSSGANYSKFSNRINEQIQYISEDDDDDDEDESDCNDDKGIKSVSDTKRSSSNSTNHFQLLTQSVVLQNQAEHLGRLNRHIGEVITEPRSSIANSNQDNLPSRKNIDDNNYVAIDDDDYDEKSSSDWDSSTDSDDNAVDQLKSPNRSDLNESRSSMNNVEVDLAKGYLTRLLEINPAIIQSSQSQLSDHDVTLLQSLKL